MGKRTVDWTLPAVRSAAEKQIGFVTNARLGPGGKE